MSNPECLVLSECLKCMVVETLTDSGPDLKFIMEVEKTMKYIVFHIKLCQSV